MRYTTIIDISEMPQIYRNHNARLVYLHLSLRSGYHDQDRDQVAISIRNLADQVGISVSACRHALQQLQTAGLLTRINELWHVKKWIIDTPPTPRQKKKEAADTGTITKLLDKRDEEIQRYRESVYAAIRACSRQELITWLEELQEGRNKQHHGAYISPNQQNIAWLKNIIKKV